MQPLLGYCTYMYMYSIVPTVRVLEEFLKILQRTEVRCRGSRAFESHGCVDYMYM